MGDTGVVKCPGNLDPMAQEFRPRSPYNHLTLVQPHIYYPCPSPPYSSSEVQVMPFCDDAGIAYPQFPTPLAYVSTAGANPPLPPRLPPPSTTPSRTLLLSSVPTDVSESTVRRELEVFGDVRAVQMERVRDGIVTVHFYDLRDAQAAMVEIREQHMQQQSRLRKHFEALLTHNWSSYEANNLVGPLPPPARGLIAGRAVWAQFNVPVMAAVPGGDNQGTLVIFNLDPQVSTARLQEIFETFGAVKELRGTPLKRHQKFIEFYDIRDAAKAFAEMNGKEISGKYVLIEFSRPGGHSKTKRFPPKATHNTNNNFDSTTNYHPLTNSHSMSPPPPHLPISVSSTAANVLPPTPTRCYPKKLNVNGESGSVEASMGSLCIGGAVGNGNEESNSSISTQIGVKNSKKGQYAKASISKQQQKERVQESKRSSSKSWKGRPSKNPDPRFLINEDAIMESNCRDSRTTVMIKNIPNKYSQKLLLNMLDNHCIHCNEQIVGNGDEQEEPLSSYDFIYLPIDFINKCNVGYGFVNMTSPQAAWRLYKAFHHQNWEVFNSRKICEVTYARLQGLEALKEHFKNSKFPGEAEDYMPVVFSPPRDGRRHLTEPIPIVNRPNSPRHLCGYKDLDHNNHDEMDGGDRPQEEEDDDNGNDDNEDNK
ncbi:protein terminal ear1-like [Cornus florida]|uniref:protein terminal ear1-like n=1 Tax=Cornus florida TaxID=4283 RepID=UPI0028997ECA|nr:protein terminal ear1-like [Cornus florida]